MKLIMDVSSAMLCPQRIGTVIVAATSVIEFHCDKAIVRERHVSCNFMRDSIASILGSITTYIVNLPLLDTFTCKFLCELYGRD